GKLVTRSAAHRGDRGRDPDFCCRVWRGVRRRRWEGSCAAPGGTWFADRGSRASLLTHLGLGRAPGGKGEAMEQSVTDLESSPASEGSPARGGAASGSHDARRLSNGQLLKGILRMGSLLVTTEIQLARAEVRADLEAEIAMMKLLAGGAVLVLLGLNLLLVAAVFALTAVM